LNIVYSPTPIKRLEVPEPNSKQVAELVSSHGHLIFRYIVRRSPQIADAEEVYQQTCPTVWQKQQRYYLLFRDL